MSQHHCAMGYIWNWERIPAFSSHMAKALGPERCIALPIFHALTGCDMVLSFFDLGKKTAWDTWMNFNDITKCILCLSCNSRCQCHR